jgi:hypothetical protein
MRPRAVVERGARGQDRHLGVLGAAVGDRRDQALVEVIDDVAPTAVPGVAPGTANEQFGHELSSSVVLASDLLARTNALGMSIDSTPVVRPSR